MAIEKETWIVAGNEIDTESSENHEKRRVANVKLELPIEVYEENLQEFFNELSDLIERYET